MAEENNKAKKLKFGTRTFLRYILHLFPLSATMTMVTINFSGIYVGIGTAWLPSLQFVAKLIEIMMQASIVAIASSYLQQEVMNHTIPLGAVFAPLQITKIGYLWSPELWGSMISPVMRNNRKALFLMSVVSSMLLASAVGPSFAIALIPRPTYYPAGYTLVWLNMTANRIFLTPLEGSMVPLNCSSSPKLPLFGTECPSSEWPAISELLSDYPGYTGNRWNSLQTTDTTRNLLVDVTRESHINSAFATVPHAPVAEALQNVADLWWTAVTSIQSNIGSLSRFKTTDNYIHTLTALQPYAVARCMRAEMTSSISFPNRKLTSDSNNGHWTNTSISMKSIGQLRTGNNSSYTISWVELPSDTFLNVSIGAIIVPPSSKEKTQLSPLACSVYAGIGNALVNLTLSLSEIISSTIPVETSVNDFLWSLSRVEITAEWADSLIPPIEGMNTTVDSAIYSTMADVLDPDEEDPNHPAYFHEALLVSLVVNGMARVGFSERIIGLDTTNDSFAFSDAISKSWLSGSNHNIFDVDSIKRSGSYQLTIMSTVSGLAYWTDGVPIKIALAVLILYCSLALIYLVYITITKLTWCNWDDVSGLTILALGSNQSQICHRAYTDTVNAEVFKEPIRIYIEIEGQFQFRLEKDVDHC